MCCKLNCDLEMYLLIDLAPNYKDISSLFPLGLSTIYSYINNTSKAVQT